MEDASRTAPPVAVLGEALWRRGFGGDPSIVGRTIRVSGSRYTVIGILPSSFRFPEQAELWLACPWCEQPPPNSRATMNGTVVARLGDASLAEASAEVRVIAQRIHQQYPDFRVNQMRTMRVRPLHEAVTAGSERRIWTLGAAMAALLLIGCANLANANLARNAVRAHELALRAALGAARRRIVQQLAVESVVLAVGAGVVGLVVASWTVRLVARYGGAHFPRLQELRLDGSAVLFAFAAAIVVAMLIGLLPALRLSAPELHAGALGAGRRSSASRRSVGRSLLLAGEIALCLVLVAAAGLAARSLQLVYREPIGVDPRGLATLVPEVSYRDYPTPASQLRLYERLLERLATVPGVERAAAAGTVPLGAGWVSLLEIEGRTDLSEPTAGYNLVTDGYFATVGVPLLRGRLFSATDDSTSVHVTVINQAMADRYWPGGEPIGRRIRAVSFTEQMSGWLTVVGVVGNVRTFSLENEDTPMHYVSAHQRPANLARTTIIARTSLDPAAVLPAMHAAVRTVDPDLLGTSKTLEQLVRESTAERREVVAVLGAFAALALLLAGIGIYGVLSYGVALRTREIGIRMALGATTGRVVRETVVGLAAPVLGGIAAGLLGAYAASTLFGALVYRIAPTDPAVLAVTCLCIVALSLAAASVPAHRAARVDPRRPPTAGPAAVGGSPSPGRRLRHPSATFPDVSSRPPLRSLHPPRRAPRGAPRLAGDRARLRHGHRAGPADARAAGAAAGRRSAEWRLRRRHPPGRPGAHGPGARSRPGAPGAPRLGAEHPHARSGLR
jgi:putative ABC transport system permease protein